jgi:hypothetical protein
MSNNKRRSHTSQSFPLSSETYACLLVSKLTKRVTSQALNWEIIFLPIWFFSPLSPCWFFIHGGKCRKLPRYVPYKGTYVPYDGTFGTSDQGQMLDVWQGEESQIHHLIRQICRFTISSVRKKLNQKRYCQIRISTRILDHMDRN